jgi:hypothetical protein
MASIVLHILTGVRGGGGLNHEPPSFEAIFSHCAIEPPQLVIGAIFNIFDKYAILTIHDMTKSFTHTHTCTPTPTRTHTYTHKYVYIYIHVDALTHAHTCTHMGIHSYKYRMSVYL